MTYGRIIKNISLENVWLSCVMGNSGFGIYSKANFFLPQEKNELRITSHLSHFKWATNMHYTIWAHFNQLIPQERDNRSPGKLALLFKENRRKEKDNRTDDSNSYLTCRCKSLMAWNKLLVGWLLSHQSKPT